MNLIKKTLIIFIILVFGSFLWACELNKKIINMNVIHEPNKTNYYLGESLDLEGLIVQIVYNDGTYELIDNYELIYSDLILGENVITIKYQNFSNNFVVYVSEYEKAKLLTYPDFEKIQNDSFDISEISFLFSSVQYGVTRGSNMVIVYDVNNFVKTNVYGYELAIDEFGCVVQKDVNVDIPENGYVVSGHGTNSKKLQEVEIGSYVLYIGNYLFVIDNYQYIKNGIFYKFIDLINLLETFPEGREYNAFVLELNKVIPLVNQLYQNYDIELAHQAYRQLVKIEQKYDLNPYEHTHEYSYLNAKYETFDLLESNPNNHLLVSSYTGKLYYGGFRNTDTLVHYDASTYRTRNEYGYEVGIDENGYVVEVGILVDLPTNGYILSGHGLASEYLKENIALNDKIEIANGIVNVYKDWYTSFYNDQIIQYNEIVTLINNEIELSIPHDYKYIDKIVRNLYNSLKTIGSDLTHYNLYQLSIFNRLNTEYISILYSQIADYKVDKTRAMWYYPFTNQSLYDDTSLEGVCKTLDTFEKMGFNEIIILPFASNYILYDSEYFYKTDKLENCDYGEYGNDYLKCFISEAHKRNISVNAFTQTFRCFLEGSKVLTEEHYQVDYNGNYSKGSIYYYDICSDEVQNTLYNWYLELVSLYDFDKIEYDIIRYSQSNLYNYLEVDKISNANNIIDPGYTESSMTKFLHKYNYEGDLRDLILNDKDVRKKWLEFKEEELIKFITRTTQGIKNINPSIIITAAVFNNFDSAKRGYLQDAQKWLELGIIDQIEPMVYNSELSFVLNKITYYQENLNDEDFRIGIGNKISLLDLCKQIYYTSSNGVVIFSSTEYLDNKYVDVLSKNHHMDVVSCISTKQEMTSAIINDLLDKIQNYYEVKNNCNYDYLESLISRKDYEKIYIELLTLNDQNMANYILEIIESIDKE